ncbi:MAG: TlpA disulfide reductase family protein [Deferrisomatales bacterium]|nr:TlpA disulfide reductase family protein [Deferrisomatales bacterium]
MVEVGQRAPALRLHDLEGRAVVLGEPARDRALLVMFCTIGCVPCRESEPLLAAAGEQYAERLATACVMLAKPAAVRALLAANGEAAALRFYADTAGPGLFPVAGAYGVMGTPTTFLIGRDGRVLWRRVGGLTRQNIEQDVLLALEEDRGGVGVAASRPLPTAQ